MTLPDPPVGNPGDHSREIDVVRSTSAMPAPGGFVDPKTIGLHDDGIIALLVRVQVPDQPSVLHALTQVIVNHQANITYVDIGDQRQQRSTTYFELSDVDDLDALVADLEALPIVRLVERQPS